MAAITPIPSTRVSDQLAHQRLMSQLRLDQLDLQRLQTQISTQRRIAFPSEDAPAALRAITLQSLLERKTQSQVNLQTNQTYLSATDAALATVSGLLNEAHGAAAAVSGTTSTDQQRSVAATELARTIQQLVDTANHQFRGRSLFAGSQTLVRPFEMVGDYVRYNGNEEDLRSFADTDLLFQTNFNGAKVFSAISTPVLGANDLNPRVTADTKLADVNAGQGVSRGSIAISDGVNTSVVDLSRAETVGDVVRLIEANAPSGRSVTARITAIGINVELDTVGGGNLMIREVAEGTTAHELGIFHDVGSGPGPFVGTDLDPKLGLLTPLGNLLGVKAQTAITSAGPNNDLFIEAKANGADLNDWTIDFVDDSSVVAGSETVNFNSATKTATVSISAGFSTARQVMDALNAHPGFSANFSATLGPRDRNNNGNGPVAVTARGITFGGAGVEFDKNAGLQIVNGGKTHVISFEDATTLQDMLNILNGSAASVVASINESGTGINIRSRLSGSDFAIGENGGIAATQLGLRTFSEDTKLADLNHGFGVHTSPGADFSIRLPDSYSLDIDVSGAQTIGDVLNLINSHGDNQNPSTRVVAALSRYGNGIELTTTNPAQLNPLTVSRRNFSVAAQDLGLIPYGSDSSAPPVTSGGTATLTGRDAMPFETQGVFNSLVKLKNALESNNLLQIERNLTSLDRDRDHINYTRGEIGARQQGLDALISRLETEQVELQESLSLEIDVDLPEAISQLLSRQAAYQASMQMAGQLSRITLLDYL